MLNELLQTTNMTRTELYKLFSRFKALCQLSGTPGSIDKKTFKEGVSSLAFEDDAFVDRVFALLDEDGSGTVESRVHQHGERAREGVAVRQAGVLLRKPRHSPATSPPPCRGRV